MFNSTFYTFVVTLGFLNTLAYPIELSLARINNVELGTNIILDRSSPPIAALEDISSPELTDDQIISQGSHPNITIITETKTHYNYIPTSAKALVIETTTVSKSSPEFKSVLASLTAPASAPKPTVSSMPAMEKSAPALAPAIKVPRSDFIQVQSTETIAGEIELGNVAFVGGDQRLSIQRFTGKIPMEKGQIQVQDGTFQIKVAARTGKLVAQLRNNNDEIVGEGVYSLLSNDYVEKIKIKIYAKSRGPNGTVVSAYSYNDYKVVVKGAKLKLDDLDRIVESTEQGAFSFDGISNKSVAVLRTTAPGFKPSIQFLAGANPTQITIYPDKMVSSLLSFAKPRIKGISNLDSKGMILGQVYSEGKPLAGVKLELAGTDGSPIYFNQFYLPELSRTETSNNGMFAYLGIDPGIYQVRGRLLDKTIDGTVVPVASGQVSPANLELSSSLVERRVGIFDFSSPGKGWLGGVLRILGLEETHNINGEGSISSAQNRVPSFLEAFAQNFYPGRIISEEANKDTSIPLVPEGLLKSYDRTRGAVMIYCQEPIENVTLNGVALESTDPNIVMFEGKGVIILNINPGLNTVITKTGGSPDLNINTLVIDANSISVIDLNNAQ